MTFEDYLYWTLLESDLHNSELYLPADTPIGKVNPKRLLKIQRKRHQRQEQRLIQQQVCELNEYQHDFSQQNKDDFFLKRQISCCEPIKGSDYLQLESDQINAFLTQIPSLVGHPSDDSIEDTPMPDKFKQDLLHILKKKYKSGFEILNDTHALKYDALLELQKQDLSVIPKDIIDPLLSPVPQQPKTKLMQNTLEKLNNLKYRSDQQDKVDCINKTMNQIQEVRDRSTFAISKLPFKSRPNSSKKVPPPISSKGPPSIATAFKSSKVPPVIATTPSKTPTNAKKIAGIPIGAGPPKVASSSSKRKKERSEPSLLRSKFEPLMDKGELSIKNNSVQIRFPDSIQKYGDPRDYDDAISYSAKSGNPVTRRHYQGRDYLFFRCQTQQVVPVGLVSKIQPLIHKYFLDQQSSVADL